MTTEANPNARLEAFCDGVFAIALTLLVLDLKTPSADDVHTARDLWLVLRHQVPSAVAFLLSFIIILISWVNHHAFMKLIGRSSPVFIFANGCLLLAMVVLPFPTALLAEFGLTDAAAPAVVLYSAVSLLAAIGWVLMFSSAFGPRGLGKSHVSQRTVRAFRIQGWGAFVIYAACTGLAFWFPRIIAVVLALLWVNWLLMGLSELGQTKQA